MKNVTKLLAAMSLALIAGCPADDDDDTGGATEAVTAGDDGATMQMDDGATMQMDDGATMVMTGDDDGATVMPDDGGSADSTAGDDGGGAMVCQFTCAADEDCLVGGTDIGFLCVDGQCSTPEPEPCAGDESCVATLSGWGAVPCTMGGGECM